MKSLLWWWNTLIWLDFSGSRVKSMLNTSHSPTLNIQVCICNGKLPLLHIRICPLLRNALTLSSFWVFCFMYSNRCFKDIILLVKQCLIHMGGWWLCLGLFSLCIPFNTKVWKASYRLFVHCLGDGSVTGCAQIKGKISFTLENYPFYACEVHVEVRLKLSDGWCFIFPLLLWCFAPL